MIVPDAANSGGRGGVALADALAALALVGLVMFPLAAELLRGIGKERRLGERLALELELGALVDGWRLRPEEDGTGWGIELADGSVLVPGAARVLDGVQSGAEDGSSVTLRWVVGETIHRIDVTARSRGQEVRVSRFLLPPPVGPPSPSAAQPSAPQQSAPAL